MTREDISKTAGIIVNELIDRNEFESVPFLEWICCGITWENYE